MAKLRANIGQETSPEIEALKGRFNELILTQFDRFFGEPLRAASRLGREVNPLDRLRNFVIDETSESFGPLFRSGKGEGVYPLDPLEAVSEGVGFGAFGATRSVSAVGQIRGLPPRATKAVRKAMQQELKARGAAMTAGREAEVASDMIRSTYFHGRKTYVEPTEGLTDPETFTHYAMGPEQSRPDLRHARGKDLEFGEPLGISMSLKPGKASSFANSEQVARVMPLFAGSPESQTIMAWTPSGGKVIKDVYETVFRDAIRNSPGMKEEFTEGLAKGYYTGSSFYGASKAAVLHNVGQREFNQALSDEYLKRGFKAIQYSPHRFDEFELKMFDPKDALMIDKRYWSGADPTFRRMGFSEIGGVPKHEEFRNLTQPTMTGKKLDLADWYRQIDLEKIIREETGVNPLPAIHKVMVKRAGSNTEPEKFFEQYIGGGDKGEVEAMYIKDALTKLFDDQELPSFTADIETFNPGDKGYLQWNIDDKAGIVIAKQPWSKEAALAQEEAKLLSVPGGVNKSDIEQSHFAGVTSEELFNKKMKGFNEILDSQPNVDVNLGVTSGTKYIGGDISEDMLSKNLKEISLDESRIGSSFESLEDLVTMFGDEARPRPKKLSPAEEYSQKSTELNQKFKAGLIGAGELTEAKVGLLKQLEKTLPPDDIGIIKGAVKKAPKIKEGTLEAVPNVGEDIGLILEKGLGKPPGVSDAIPSETFSWLSNKLGVGPTDLMSKLTPGQYHFQNAADNYSAGGITNKTYFKERLLGTSMMKLEKQTLEKGGQTTLEFHKAQFEAGDIGPESYIKSLENFLSAKKWDTNTELAKGYQAQYDKGEITSTELKTILDTLDSF